MRDPDKRPDVRGLFTNIKGSTERDWRIIEKYAKVYQRDLGERVIAHLELLSGYFDGYPVDRLEHSLQTASRAFRDGRDEEYVICALLHDIGDTLGCANHEEVAAAILKPYVSEQHHWMIDKHAIFQGLYYYDHIGLDPNMRDQYRGHPWFEIIAEFCELYDQSSFDSTYLSMPLNAFKPMVCKFLSQPKRSIASR